MTGLPLWLAAISSAATLVLVAALLLRRSNSRDAAVQLREEVRAMRADTLQAARQLRQEVSAQTSATGDSLVKAVGELGKAQGDRLEAISTRVRDLTVSNEERLEKVRATVDQRIRGLQESNEKKLDQMRQTVDERLQTTLEKRLTDSFKVVSDSLEAVQRGLGEMQTLATGVGDLKRVLTNVKTRGTWGEVQLGALLEDMLAPDQYERDASVSDTSREKVEYAVRLPGRVEADPDAVVLLPIDAKFPQEDYQRLVEASEIGDLDGVKVSSEALIRSLNSSAKDIHDKYVRPPRTTDFAVMFLPTEGLYAELLRKPGQLEELQRRYRVVVAGPTTLSALLSSLRMGFRTLAIEKRSSEVWNVLAAVKTEFGKFGDVLSKLKRQLQTASNTVEETGVRTRAMARKLRSVEQLPTGQVSEMLGTRELLPDPDDSEDEAYQKSPSAQDP